MTKPKIFLLTKYSRQGASSRLRTFQYIPFLTKIGFDVQVFSFFDDEYIHRLYYGKKNLLHIIYYYIRRMYQLQSARHADVIWIEKEIFPWLPWWLEKLLLPSGVPIVADYDDAIFHIYDTHRSRFVRKILGLKIDHVMKSSCAVCVGNDYLAERAKSAGSENIFKIPTVVDIDAYQNKKKYQSHDQCCIGWIGTPKTWKEHCLPMLPLLSKIIAKNNSIFHAIGAGKSEVEIPNFKFLEWSEKTEISQIQNLDIGIMPLSDTLFSRGKCGYKLIQYMACGIPVIATPLGVNKKIVEHGVTGFLVENEHEWGLALEKLLSNPELRRKMGDAARIKIVQQYSIQVYGPKVADILYKISQNTNI